MDNFEYRSPTNVVFGKDQLEKLPELLKSNDVKRILLVYGRESIKSLGIYGRIHTLCETIGVEVYEESGVRPNPDIASVYSGRRTVKENDVDFILAAGGGSVIDAAKAIAFSVFIEEDAIWETYLKKRTVKQAMPLGTVLTLAATGSETNGNTVLSNDAAKDKRGIASPHLIPEFSIIDPAHTFSVPRHHTFAGSIDIMMHIFEQYFSPTPRTETADYMALGILKSVIENTNRIKDGEDDYDTRANISWAATLAWNWILSKGKVGDWATHRISYPFTMRYGITHGYALSTLFPSWIEVALKKNPGMTKFKLDRLAREVFGGNGEDVPEALRELFRTWGAPASIEDNGVTITEKDAKEMAAKTMELGPVGKLITVDEAVAEEIYLNARNR